MLVSHAWFRAALIAGVIGSASPVLACDAFVGGCANVDLSDQRVGQKYRHATGVVGHRPRGCPSRLWCACFAALRFLGLSPNESKRRGLWRARAWAKIGTPAPGPAPGVIAVYARGKRGGHVGIVKRVVDHDTIILLSGNDGNRVRQRPRSIRGVIAWRWIGRDLQ